MLFKFLLVALMALVGSVSCFIQGRVVNGIESDITKFPFVVSLRNGKSHNCGGSIINQRWILTAAHCVDRRSASQLSVQFGTTVISENGKNVVNVNRIVMHKHFSRIEKRNDIALLELQELLVFDNKTIAPVKLPDSYFEVPQTGASGVLIGWGAKSDWGNAESILQEATLTIYSDRDCYLKHSGETSTKEICAGVGEGEKGQCSGDSGGPLLYNGSVQVGIVSWSIKPCGNAIYPGVYTKVSHYIDWINNNIK